MARVKQRPHLKELAAYADWEWHYAQVEAFVRERGHCNLGEHPAGEWLRQQQQAAIAGRLSVERQSRLSALGVSFDSGDDDWSAMLQRLRDYLIRHRVLKNKGRAKWLPDPPDGELAAWLREQRAQLKSGLLPPARARLLARLKLLSSKHVLLLSAPEAGSSGTRRDELWEAHLAVLVAFKQEFGHCEVPQGRTKSTLAHWVSWQRKMRAWGRMDPRRIERLDALGFIWATDRSNLPELWERRYAQIIAFKQEHGHTRVPKSFDKQLWHWRHVQREFRKKGKLKPGRIARLDAIAFEWEDEPIWGRSLNEAIERKWEAKFQQLADFHSRHGHVNAPNHGKENPSLGAWLNKQRKDCRMGNLRPDRLARLESMGFVASPGRPSHDASWEKHFAELVNFHQEHGHTRITAVANDRLSEWRYVQRTHYRKGLLSPERIARLDALGFEWVPPESSGLTQQERWDQQWLRMFEQLVQFKHEQGHCHVLTKWEGNPSLAEWVLDQRSLKNHGKLRPERQVRLDAIGFLWIAENIESDARWERSFLQLCDYQQQHGHTRVPKTFDRKLWRWRHVQREYKRKGRVSAERIARLDSIGFEWDERGKPWAKSRGERWDRQWDQMYEQLIEFQRQHGTTHVVTGWPENPRLAAWVGDQREREHHGGLRPDRKARLEAIGFVWNPGQHLHTAKWEERYAQIIAFKEQHGHTRVPKSFDKQLWHWRHVQREYRKKGMLKPERIASLDAIGFEWEGRDPPPAP